MKKSFTLSVFISFLLIFTAIPDFELTKANESIPQATKLKIPVILKTETPPYWQAIIYGMQKAGEDYGAEVLIQSPKSLYPEDLEEELSLFKNALTTTPQAIVISPINSNAFTPYLEAAKNANIPVIGLDTDVVSPIVRTAVATDNYGVGELAAHKMAELIGQRGNVAVITLTTPIQSLLYRQEGFENTIKENYPNIKILKIPYTLTPTEDLKKIIRYFILENPDIKGIFATAANESRDVLDVVKELGKEEKIKIIATDSDKKINEAIKDGTVSGAIVQDPRSMGYKAIEAAVKAAQGEKLPEFINTGFAWYDRSNINRPEIKAHLYE